MKDAILATAAKRFARYGFYKTTIEDIASDLKKVKSAVYYYFENKEEIFKAVLQKELEELSAGIRKRVDETEKPGDKLKTFIKAHLDAFAKITKGFSTIKEIYLKEHDFVGAVRKNYDDRSRSYIEDIIKEGNRRGEFCVKETRKTAFAVLTVIRGAEYELAAKEKPSAVGQITGILAGMLVDGLCGKRSGGKKQ